MKKWLALALAICLVLGTASALAAPLFSDTVTISMMIRQHPTWPYQEDWPVVQYIKEAANVELNLQVVPEDGYNDKVNLIMASQQLPDLMWVVGSSVVNQYAPQGAFVNIMEHIDEMPNFKKWYEENQDYALSYLSSDGSLYLLPQMGAELSNRQGYLYRKDVFDKLDIAVPTNKEEFYNALKTLKEAYPDSYPFVFRGAYDRLAYMGTAWGTSYIDLTDNRLCWLDAETQEWEFGPIENNFKEMISFYHQLYEEELLMPNTLSIDTKGWQDVISNSDSFVTFDYLSRIDFFNVPMRESDPDFTMDYMVPAVMTEDGDDKIAYSPKDTLGFVIYSGTKHLDEVLAYADWLYSDEAYELLSWGREGKFYEVVDGERKWKTFTTAAEMKQNTGFETEGMYLYYNFDAEYATFSAEVQAATTEARAHETAKQPVLSYNEEEQKIFDTIGNTIVDYVNEEVSKFILGSRDLSTWDDFVQEVKNLGLDRVIAIHESSYARVLAVKNAQ